MFFLMVVGIIFCIYLLNKDEKSEKTVKLSDDKAINDISYQSPIPFNLRKQTAIKEYLNVEIVNIDTKDSSPIKADDNIQDENDKDVLEPDSILVNANTGEIQVANDQFDTSEFIDDNDIEPVVKKERANKPKRIGNESIIRDRDDWKQKNAAAIKDLL